MFKDIVGKIDPKKMFNVWRFSKSRSTYKLVSDTIIYIKDEKLIKAYKTMNKKGLNMSSWFLIREIGEKADNEVIKQGFNKEYDAWVIANIAVYTDTIDVWIDLFKRDTLWNKLLYFIRGTCVKSEK